MRKGFLIYDEMRKYLAIYEEAVSVALTELSVALSFAQLA
jgi:hypothetical protein